MIYLQQLIVQAPTIFCSGNYIQSNYMLKKSSADLILLVVVAASPSLPSASPTSLQLPAVVAPGGRCAATAAANAAAAAAAVTAAVDLLAGWQDPLPHSAWM